MAPNQRKSFSTFPVSDTILNVDSWAVVMTSMYGLLVIGTSRWPIVLTIGALHPSPACRLLHRLYVDIYTARWLYKIILLVPSYQNIHSKGLFVNSFQINEKILWFKKTVLLCSPRCSQSKFFKGFEGLVVKVLMQILSYHYRHI